MNYHEWDYDTTGWTPKDTNENIRNLLKTESIHTIKEFTYWLSKNHSDFAYSYRDVFIPALLESQHFTFVDELLENKTYRFDEKISKNCGFYLGLNFNDNFFNYWKNQAKKLDRHTQSTSYKNFWHEFFSYQFLRSEDVMNNLPNLEYVFDKIPFYMDSEYDIINGYLIKSREDFFKNRLPNLDKELRPIILQKLAILCGQHYSQFKSTFQEEFKNFPEFFSTFDKAASYQKLNQQFESKPSSKKTKI